MALFGGQAVPAGRLQGKGRPAVARIQAAGHEYWAGGYPASAAG
jgi:hypothetical protein